MQPVIDHQLAGTPTCPCCDTLGAALFYRVARTPANSCLLISSRQEALEFPCGVLDLACCDGCGFVWNVSFDPRLIEYSERYEETQGFSPTFGRFHRQLALDLIDRYDLRGKQILEIGCGKGEFLALLCELGGNTGVGFDPAYREGRLPPETAEKLTFYKDLYSERYDHLRADFICCKMTLEHIAAPREFVQMLRKTVGDAGDTLVFILVPDGGKIIAEGAFEDFYYEHCSYFSLPSLRRLFADGGFTLSSVESVYDGQYLALAATPRPAGLVSKEAADHELVAHKLAVEGFATRCADQRQTWHQCLSNWQRQGSRTVLWGSGSKAVGFLTAVPVTGAIDAVVDINPHKAGTFVAGTGQQIISPRELRAQPPDRVIIMNPIYRQEIAEQLQELGLYPELLILREPPSCQGDPHQ